MYYIETTGGHSSSDRMRGQNGNSCMRLREREGPYKANVSDNLIGLASQSKWISDYFLTLSSPLFFLSDAFPPFGIEGKQLRSNQYSVYTTSSSRRTLYAPRRY
jgi:hypothetical protein